MTVRACAASPCRAEVYGTSIVNGACAPPYCPPALSEGSATAHIAPLSKRPPHEITTDLSVEQLRRR